MQIKASALNPVWALAQKGGETALVEALMRPQLLNLRVMSPSLCGSSPYPLSSLTYRVFIFGYYNFHYYIFQYKNAYFYKCLILV